jgi:hypothetical protein
MQGGGPRYPRLLFRLVTPSRFATDASAIVRPAEEWPFRSSLLASFSSLAVGGVIISLLFAMENPLKPFYYKFVFYAQGVPVRDLARRGAE